MYECISTFSFGSLSKLKITNADFINKGEVIAFSSELKKMYYKRKGVPTSYIKGSNVVTKLSLKPYRVCNVMWKEDVLDAYNGNDIPPEGETIFSFDLVPVRVQIIKSVSHTKYRLKQDLGNLTPAEILTDILFVTKWDFKSERITPVEFQDRLKRLDRMLKVQALAIGGVGGEKETAIKVFNNGIYKIAEDICQTI